MSKMAMAGMHKTSSEKEDGSEPENKSNIFDASGDGNIDDTSGTGTGCRKTTADPWGRKITACSGGRNTMAERDRGAVLDSCNQARDLYRAATSIRGIPAMSPFSARLGAPSPTNMSLIGSWCVFLHGWGGAGGKVARVKVCLHAPRPLHSFYFFCLFPASLRFCCRLNLQHRKG